MFAQGFPLAMSAKVLSRGMRRFLLSSLAVVLLGACTLAMPTPTVTPVPNDVTDAIREATVKTNELWVYLAVANLAIRYEDESEKKVSNARMVVEPSDGRMLCCVPKISLGISDPIHATSSNDRVDYGPQVLTYRQPGNSWIFLNKAMEYLASAPTILEVAETTEMPEVVGVEATPYRAIFPSRPDLETYTSGLIETAEASLMRSIYSNSSVTVDFWISKSDQLVRRIEVVTRGINYPGPLPEPNDLRGAVEERATLTFHRFNDITLTFADVDLQDMGNHGN